jgi:hypothetical protein
MCTIYAICKKNNCKVFDKEPKFNDLILHYMKIPLADKSIINIAVKNSENSLVQIIDLIKFYNEVNYIYSKIKTYI